MDLSFEGAWKRDIAVKLNYPERKQSKTVATLKADEKMVSIRRRIEDINNAREDRELIEDLT